MSQEYVVIDLETTVKNRGPDAIGDMQASVYHPDNKIVVFGKKPECDVFSVKLWVMQNAAFDTQYIIKGYPGQFKKWLKAGGQIYCCQIAEYLLTGQQHTFASLDELSAKYGGTQKDNRISDMWAAGVDTEDIDPQLLKEYNDADLSNTEIVFLRQRALLKEKGLRPLAKVAFEDRLFTILMEWNGMRFKREQAMAQAEEMRKEFENIRSQICSQVAPDMPEGFKFNPGSGDHVSIRLFGGNLKHSAYESEIGPDGAPILFKTGDRKGQPRMAKVKKVREYPEKNRKHAVPVAKEGFFSTDEDTVVRIAGDPKTDQKTKEFVELLLAYRRLGKDISTYYVGYSELTWPTDGCIHPSINHTATETGRQSCSKPNLQNCSRANT